MLSLSQIFLHNWHRFTHHLIPVQDSLYLAGHNGSGKSSVLDALQTVLVANQSRVRFNSSAQERSQRTLDSYVRGKMGEGRWLRPGNTVAYVALEFADSERNEHITCGVCIEAGEGKTTERTFFLITDALNLDLLLPEGRPLPRRELRQTLRNRRKARTFEQVQEYQTELLNSLGGLNDRFFDLFIRALTFQPMRNIREFVERWLLEEHPLDVETLQRVVERLEQLRIAAHQVEEKLYRLEAVEHHRSEAYRWQAHHAEYTLLVALLAVEQARQRVADLAQQITETQQQLATRQSELATAQAALTNAQEALNEIRVQLRQSDVMQRRANLERQIRETTHQADAIRARWSALLADLQRERVALQPVLAPGAADSPLEAAEQESLAALQSTIAALTPDTPPPDTLPTQADAAIAALDSALVRNQEAYYATQADLREQRTRKSDLEKRLAQLRQNRKPYPQTVEKLRELLEPIVGQRPPLLCDLLEVPDEHWQNAVEAMLGPRRFHIIVLPRHFPAALRELDRARAEQRLYDVGLIDLERAAQDGRKAYPGSLAEQVQPRSDVLRPYINTVLGNIICCASVDELRQHRRAITADVVLYSEWTVRALRPDTYTPRYIGRRAQQSLIAETQHELQQVNDRLQVLEPRERDQRALVDVLSRGRSLSNLRQRFDSPLDEHPLRQQCAAWQAEIESLDLSGVAELEREEQRLTTLVEQERERERQSIQQIERLKHTTELHTEQHRAAERERTERERHSQTERERLPEAVAAAEKLLADRLGKGDLADAIRNAEATVSSYKTRLDNELRNLTEAATAYNYSYQFKGITQELSEPRYREELERLQATELPRYTEQIEQAQREAEEELREHVLHRLREHILLARQELDRINDALSRLQFHGERYRFKAQPADEVREYYDLISDAQLLGTAGALFKSEFYASHKATFDRFYDLLTRIPKNDAERDEQRRLTDYRSYLSYDIDVTHADGTTSRLSRIMGQTSGGETQTPFYVTIAASFAQLYHINERHQRPTIRMVAFDEAFSKMDQDRIGATLELLQSFGLQIITATPLERCEYLVPHICTNLVLTAVGDTVLVEPYRNYAARLAAFAAEQGNGAAPPDVLPDETHAQAAE
jgi:uncharacterized protein YPO0396